MSLRGGNRKSNGHDVSLKLEDVDISHKQSSRWQAVASLPEDTFSNYIAAATEKQIELTTAGALRLAKSLKAREHVSADESTDEGCVVEDEIANLPTERFGCIYADPPWAYGNQSTRAASCIPDDRQFLNDS